MDGILSTISTNIQSIPFRQHPRLTVFATSSALVLPFAIRNYLAFLRLRPPKLLANPFGWLLSLTLRVIGRETKSTEEYDRVGEVKESWLGDDFAWRKGDRPEIGWFPAPHRQVSQYSTNKIREGLSSLLEDIASKNSSTLEVRTSKQELETKALFVTQRIINNPPHATCPRAYGEVAHIHDSFDYSIHVVLSPQDCKKVIEHCWGERHPCSGRVRSLPKEYILIYTPRNKEELSVVKDIVLAAARFMSGENIL